jgi:O-antigen ligase
LKTLWIYFLPFLFFPNLGLANSTSFGALELSDFLLVPFLALLYLSPKLQGGTLSGEIKRTGLIFVLWAFASTLGIYVWYQYDKPIPVLVFSMLKLAKFVLYAHVGLLIARSLYSDELRRKYDSTLLWAGVVTGIALMLLLAIKAMIPGGGITGYKSTNLVSAGLSILTIYILCLFLQGYGTPGWRKWALISLVIMGIGLTFSSGRGGWLAAIVGFGYILSHTKIKVRTMLMGIAGVLGVIILYNVNPGFQKEIDKTFSRDDSYLTKYHAGVAGVDDGSRLYTWGNELAKFPNSPVLGTGFYHRGSAALLWETGSHNFWLQMFLETGAVGGILILIIFLKMWKHAHTVRVGDRRISIALKAALITAFIGGLSGEYFYGGYGLLTLFLVYAPTGSYRRDTKFKTVDLATE